jgi:hypothetical protein
MSAERIFHTNIFSGVWDLFTKDLDKSVEDCYAHQIATTPSGGSLIFTANSYLLNLIHTATGLHANTTFKRAAGDHKEVEFAIWVPAVQRGRSSTVFIHYCSTNSCLAAVTIARVYSNHADQSQYKAIFDAFQGLMERLTDKCILLKQISKGGTLLCFHVDFKAAQVLSLGDSFLPTNEPDHSGLPKNTNVEIFVQSFC